MLTIIFGIIISFRILGYCFPRHKKVKEPLKITGRVARVLDGDTILVGYNGGTVRVRLAFIDAPEHGQAWAEESMQLLCSLILGKDVTIIPRGTDYYGRLLGEIFIGQSYINYWLVRKGLAWALPDTAPESHIATAHLEAQAERVGLWRDSYPTQPWEFRKTHKESGVVE
jgi:micrococcal nuclease